MNATWYEEEKWGAHGAPSGEAKLRRQVRSQAQLGNEVKKGRGAAAPFCRLEHVAMAVPKFLGAPGRIRTCGQRIRSSYTGTFGGISGRQKI